MGRVGTAVDEAAAGPLPWDIELIATDGSIFGTVHETADSFLGYVTVRADGVVAGDAPAIGPAPVGCP